MKYSLMLKDVQETALIPLSNRASETLRKHPRIQDPKAVEIIQKLNIDPRKYDKYITHECVIARTILFDETVRKYIEKYPDAVCMNLGCGMDDRFSRVDNNMLLWFDIDLPESIAVRKKIFPETTRRKMIAKDILRPDWIQEIKHDPGWNNQKVIVIAEGLLMYFSKEETKKILQLFSKEFPEGILIAELMRLSMMNEKRHETVKKTNAKFGWGTNSGKEFEELNPDISLISEHSFSEQMIHSTISSKIIGLITWKVNNRIAVYQWTNNKTV